MIIDYWYITYCLLLIKYKNKLMMWWWSVDHTTGAFSLPFSEYSRVNKPLCEILYVFYFSNLETFVSSNYMYTFYLYELKKGKKLVCVIIKQGNQVRRLYFSVKEFSELLWKHFSYLYTRWYRSRTCVSLTANKIELFFSKIKKKNYWHKLRLLEKTVEFEEAGNNCRFYQI